MNNFQQGDPVFVDRFKEFGVIEHVERNKVIVLLINQKTIPKPRIKDNVPKTPKKCIGFFPNFVINVMVNKSRNPFTKRFNPNLDLPYFRS